MPYSPSASVDTKLKNISANNDAMLLKLGGDRCYTLINIADGTHFDVAMATCSVPVSSSSKSNITICSFTGQIMHLKMLKGKPNEGGTGLGLR